MATGKSNANILNGSTTENVCQMSFDNGNHISYICDNFFPVFFFDLPFDSDYFSTKGSEHRWEQMWFLIFFSDLKICTIFMNK